MAKEKEVKGAEYAPITEVLKKADALMPLVNKHIQDLLHRINPGDNEVSSVEINAVALNLMYGAFTLLLSNQLQGKDLEHTEETLDTATNLMNLAANMVMIKIPGNQIQVLDDEGKPHVLH